MKKILLLSIIIFLASSVVSVYKAAAQEGPVSSQQEAVSSGTGQNIYGSEDAYQIREKEKEKNKDKEQAEEAVLSEEPAPYPIGQQDMYESRDSSLRLNPYTGQYEQATPNEELRFNPSTGTWSYENPNATMQFNQKTGKWEYSDKPL